MITPRTLRLDITYEDDGSMPEASELTDNPYQTIPRLAGWIEALGGGNKVGTLSMLTDDGDSVAATGSLGYSGTSHGTAATGTIALSGVGGAAARANVTLAGGAGNVTIVTDGTSVGPVAFNTSDAQTATDCITALNANGTFAPKATATSGGSGIITITWDTKGTVGNSKTLTASRTAGTATASSATLLLGAQGTVTVVLNGTSVGPTDVTTLTDTAAATTVAAAIEANTTLGPLAVVTGSTTNVAITWGVKGTVGNAITLTSTSATGTATASGATLSGGANTSVHAFINGVDLTVDTSNTSTDEDVAAATKAVIDASTNPLVAGVVTAAVAGSDVELTAVLKGNGGNMITLAASGTGTSVTGNRLTGGVDATTTATLDR